MLYLSLIGLLLAFALFYYFAVYNPGAQSHWEILPTRAEYQLKHPDCTRDEQMTCCHCHSSEMLDVGVLGFRDWRRQIICRGCKNRLWRESD
jgi:hypothetical protein